MVDTPARSPWLLEPGPEGRGGRESACGAHRGRAEVRRSEGSDQPGTDGHRGGRPGTGSPGTVHKWLAKYQAGGLGWLADRSHRPNSCPHQMAPDVEARVLDLRRAHPGWGPLRLRHALWQEGMESPPGRSSIYRALVRGGLIQPRPRRKKKSWRRWERARPMELWQMDVMGARLADGTEFKVVTGVDDHSRFCVVAKAVPRATAGAVCDAFAEAMRRYGIPEGC